MRLWYKKCAEDWVEALPVGNGRLGAMVYGKTDKEIISLNEDTLWSGYPRDLNPKGKNEKYLEARNLASKKKFKECQQVIEEHITSSWGQSYLPLGDLILGFNHDKVENYERELDLNTAVTKVRYSVNDTTYTREIFASAPDNVLVVKISADKNSCVSLTIGLDCQLKSATHTDNNELVLLGQAPSHVEPSYSGDLEEPVVYSDVSEERGMLFTSRVKVMPCGGELISNEGTITVINADSVIILVAAQTSFSGYDVHPYVNGKDYIGLCLEDINKASSKNYDEIITTHINDYEKYFNRVTLNIGESESAGLPTDKRLYNFLDNANDPSLYTLLFQYGRYLLISSSRVGTQPANLQGIWNKELRAPWSSNYTLNINTEMNYWPVFSTGLGELQQPLVKLIEEISVEGRKTAKEVYNANGFVSHHNTDIWRVTSPMGNHWENSANYAFWNMSGAWLCRHLFEQYEYTLDKEFLRQTAYPIMKSAADFLLDIITTDEDGYFIISPSTSPENVFKYEGDICRVAETATMTMTIVKELFNNCIKVCEILGINNELAYKLRTINERVYPYKTGSKGQLLEWESEYEEIEVDHRHISHLYGLHPSNEITIEDTPELAKACETSLNIRGDEGTGWSLGWKISQWARLFDGDRALKLLRRQLQVVDTKHPEKFTGGGTYLNLFDAHPPFQIDGNFAATAGIAEMLLQSRENKVFILPALPRSWGKGSVKGLCAKQLITVNISWDNGSVEAQIISQIDQIVRVAVKGIELETVSLKAGVPLVIKK